MSSFRDSPSTVECDSTKRFSEEPSIFRRRLVRNAIWVFPRRYVLALMLFLLLIIQTWRSINVIFSLAYVIVLGEEAKAKYPSIGHWTMKELDDYKTVSLVADILSQLPGALLIFIFSSHKFILVSEILISLLHMLTPVALSHHSASLLTILMSMSIIQAPTNTAVFTIWKDWAPPAERSKLLIFSLYGLFAGAAATTFYPFLFTYVTSDASYYLSGIAGIIWTLFWYNITADTPQNDPLISQDELLYLECHIPSHFQQKIKIKDIPWKSIVTSKKVLLISLIFFKVASSIEVITIAGTLYTYHLSDLINPLNFFIPFLTTYMVILPCTAMLADCLKKKYSGRSLLIKKVFLCGGFLFQSIFLFGTLAKSYFTRTIFFMVAYSFFAISVPGFITIPLDLSPRYVSIICGFIFFSFKLGIICVAYFVETTIMILHLDTLTWLFLFDGLLTIIAAVLFWMSDDFEEQLWSHSVSSAPKADYRSYPKPDDEDDLNLVPENA